MVWHTGFIPIGEPSTDTLFLLVSTDASHAVLRGDGHTFLSAPLDSSGGWPFTSFTPGFAHDPVSGIWVSTATDNFSGFGSDFYRSLDAGKTWVACTTSPQLTGGAYRLGISCFETVFIVPGYRQISDFVFEPLLWRSTDGGNNFVMASTPPTGNYDMHSVFHGPSNTLLGIVGGGGLFVTVSTDLGDTWSTPVYPGVDLNTDPIWTGTRWVATGTAPTIGGGAVATSSDGITWTAVHTPFETVGTSVTTFPTGDCIGQLGSRLIIFGLSGDGAIRCITSDNDGSTWTARACPWDGTGAANGARSIAVESGVAYASAVSSGLSPAKVLATSTDGATWTVVDLGLAGGGSYDSNWLLGGHGVVIYGQELSPTTGLLKSTNDGGATWTDLVLPAGVVANNILNINPAVATVPRGAAA